MQPSQPREGQMPSPVAEGNRLLPRRDHDLRSAAPGRLRLQLPLHDPPLQRQLLAHLSSPHPGLSSKALQEIGHQDWSSACRKITLCTNFWVLHDVLVIPKIGYYKRMRLRVFPTVEAPSEARRKLSSLARRVDQ